MNGKFIIEIGFVSDNILARTPQADMVKSTCNDKLSYRSTNNNRYNIEKILADVAWETTATKTANMEAT
jgi:hypothetical protein